ncbi:MAG: hypothetical protein JRI68_29975 [Deltaproteobacteria bacterium]|nr:hypothetical protein [Deltaproteobacteria bacterium]
MSDDRTITDDERVDDDDTSGPGMTKRLAKVNKILAKVVKRLDKINAGFMPPPDDNKPAIVAALGDVKAKSQTAIDTATAIEAKLRTIVGPDG